jgi:hypothetical protein
MPLKQKPNFLTFEEVNTEIGNAANAVITMNDTFVRRIANINTPNATISVNDFFGRSLLFVQQGKFYTGGYWIGTLASSGSVNQNYYMVVAPKASGQSARTWLTTYSVGTAGGNDGLELTNNNNNGNHPLLSWVRSLNINGYSDWFIPSATELRRQYINRANLAAVTPTEAFDNANYWSSNRAGYYTAYGIYFGNGSGFNADIFSNFNGRATRRELIT